LPEAKASWHSYPLIVRITGWQTFKRVSVISSDSWQTRSILAKSSKSLWSNRSCVDLPIEVIFNDLRYTSASCHLIFNNRIASSASVRAGWKIISLWGVRIDLQWIVRIPVCSVVDSSWRIYETPPSRSIALKWNVRRKWKVVLESDWSHRQTVSLIASTGWCMDQVNAKIITSWKAVTPVSVVVEVLFNTKAIANKRTSCKWHDYRILWWSRSARYRILSSMVFIRNKSVDQPRLASGGFLPVATAATLGRKHKKRLGLK
jgi:hypothetical protein